MRKSQDASGTRDKRRPRVFIGSSSEGLEVARALQSALYYQAEPVVWSQGVFGLSGGTLESLVAECENFDFAVFVLSPDDLVQRRRHRGNVPRDNVLFELGLFMGKLGRDRTFFLHCRSDDLLLPTDLAGVTAATYLPPSEPRYLHAALSAAASPILAAVQTLGPRAVGVAGLNSPRKEMDELRAQVAEMRIALSSFAAYAQRLPSREQNERGKATGIKEEDQFEILLGTWEGETSGSMAWCHIENGKPRFVYCYGGSRTPTGEYYDWKRTGDSLVGKFQWFLDKDISGYGWFEVIGAEQLRGGWWMHDDVPEHLISKLPHVPGMVPSEWNKISPAINAKGRKYLREYPPGAMGSNRIRFHIPS
jgi:hypothetical protein